MIATSNHSERSPLTFVDLFAGIGGFHLGLKEAAKKHGYSIKLKFASEIDSDAAEVYRHNYGSFPLGDVREIGAGDAEGVDLMFGGFPCQPFSNSGRKKGIG